MKIFKLTQGRIIKTRQVSNCYYCPAIRRFTSFFSCSELGFRNIKKLDKILEDCPLESIKENKR